MRSSYPENVQEHGQQIAAIAYGLAVIKNRLYKGKLDADRIATLSVFHDAAEVIAGDLPTPVKYFNKKTKKGFDEIEKFASERLFEMLPEKLKEAFRPIMFKQKSDEQLWKYVKYADIICNYIKCLEELKMGNREFEKAYRTVKARLGAIDDKAVSYFIKNFIPSFSLTLDELNS